MTKETLLNEIFGYIENDDLREQARGLSETIPNYFWEVGASSTGKYHPSYALGEMGLARHTLAVVRFANHLLSLQPFRAGEGGEFTSRERDCIRIACFMHDTRKSGDDEYFKTCKYTRFDHPLLAAQVVRKFWFGRESEQELIASCIDSHMGQWNTNPRYNEELPLPKTKAQLLVHMADYLASRKDLDIRFDGVETEAAAPVSQPQSSKPTYWDVKIPFGKYNGKTVKEVSQIDPQYLVWLKGRDLRGELAKEMEKVDMFGNYTA